MGESTHTFDGYLLDSTSTPPHQDLCLFDTPAFLPDITPSRPTESLGDLSLETDNVSKLLSDDVLSNDEDFHRYGSNSLSQTLFLSSSSSSSSLFSSIELPTDNDHNCSHERGVQSTGGRVTPESFLHNDTSPQLNANPNSPIQTQSLPLSPLSTSAELDQLLTWNIRTSLSLFDDENHQINADSGLSSSSSSSSSLPSSCSQQLGSIQLQSRFRKWIRIDRRSTSRHRFDFINLPAGLSDATLNLYFSSSTGETQFVTQRTVAIEEGKVSFTFLFQKATSTSDVNGVVGLNLPVQNFKYEPTSSPSLKLELFYGDNFRFEHTFAISGSWGHITWCEAKEAYNEITNLRQPFDRNTVKRLIKTRWEDIFGPDALLDDLTIESIVSAGLRGHHKAVVGNSKSNKRPIIEISHTDQISQQEFCGDSFSQGPCIWRLFEAFVEFMGISKAVRQLYLDGHALIFPTEEDIRNLQNKWIPTTVADRDDHHFFRLSRTKSIGEPAMVMQFVSNEKKNLCPFITADRLWHHRGDLYRAFQDDPCCRGVTIQTLLKMDNHTSDDDQYACYSPQPPEIAQASVSQSNLPSTRLLYSKVMTGKHRQVPADVQLDQNWWATCACTHCHTTAIGTNI